MEIITALARQEFQDRVSQLWDMGIKSVCSDAQIEGSPERSLSRAVFEDFSGRRFLIEMFAGAKYRQRDRVARTLALLNRSGLGAALAPEPAVTGEYLPFIGEDCFQITRYLYSTGIDRPGWLSSPDMGAAMAGFLVDMHRAAPGLSTSISFPFFSIKDYIYKLFRDMEIRHPDYFNQYLPVLKFLEKGFMAAHDGLPAGFCHGDFHPLNVIWRDHGLKAVIDWEFSGLKPDCYDAANLVGCAGIEHPEGLAMPMVTTFLSRLKDAGIMGAASLNWFPEYVLALRFAWLSEWLRKEDREMLETELAFMNILMGHMDELKDIWGLINK
ncbi:MAG: aminoglycoside phosphotransferase family protein [Desulfobacter sp.]|nr:MAG: aminoglycoside phosphotransferase family protein [Desulfobacter sp.]